MKKVLIHILPVALGFTWLILVNRTFNPLFLKGPDFLKFYLILIFGFYASVLVLKFFKETISGTTYCFMALIFLTGIVKMIRGILLGKPVGFLILILVLEFIVLLAIKRPDVNHRIK